jgi:hypothetical protein
VACTNIVNKSSNSKMWEDGSEMDLTGIRGEGKD